MISKFIGKLKSSPLAKRHLELIFIKAIEDDFDFDKKIIGSFKDSFNKKYDLLFGLRSKLKPGWQSMLNTANNTIPAKADLRANLREAKRRIRDLKNTLKSFNVVLQGKTILEIGCFNGMKTDILALEDCLSVTGSDVSFYYEKQTNERSEPAVNNYLNQLRQTVTNLFTVKDRNIIDKKVKFVEDDISKSSLPDNSFDIIVSWETLEHIIDINSAFANIQRLLRPNGISIHQYNPFFSLNGGHSLCTLDFLWGHCRLNENDVIRYFKEIRSEEYQLASSFYMDGLNRMAQSDLKIASEKAGLEILTLIPFVKKAHLSVYMNDFYEETKQHYPNVEPIDLISPIVWIVHKKK